MVLIGTLSLREARSGTNAVKYTAISTGGLQGIPMRTIPCPLIRCFIGSREQKLTEVTVNGNKKYIQMLKK